MLSMFLVVVLLCGCIWQWRAAAPSPRGITDKRGSWLALCCVALVIPGCSGGSPEDEPVLSRVEPAASADCPHGGSVVLSGIDEDGDGALDDAEVQTREHVCNEPDEPVLLTRWEELGASESCADGGYALHTGPDANGNGALDPEEITATEHLCGGSALTRTEVVSPGAQCAAGGLAVYTGVDIDRDGALDDAEIAATTYRCGNVLEADVVIGAGTDLALLADIAIVAGNVIVAGDAESLALELPALQWIRGNLSIASPKLERVHLPQLAWIEGSLEVLNSTALTAVELPALETIDGPLSLINDDALVLFDTPSLRAVGAVTVTGNAALEHLDMQGTQGAIEISDNGALLTASLEIDEIVGSDAIALSGNPSLAEVIISGSAAPDSFVTAPDLTIFDNAALATVTVAMSGVMGDVVIRENALLDTLHLELAGVADDVQVHDNPALTVLRLRGVLLGSILVLRNQSLLTADFIVDDLVQDQFGGEVTDDVVIQDNPALTHVSLFVQHGPGLTPQGRIGDELRVQGNPALTELFLIVRGSIDGDVLVTDTPNLDTLAVQTCKIGGSLRVIDSGAQRISGTFDDCTTRVVGSLELRRTRVTTFETIGEFALERANIVIAENPVLLSLNLHNLILPTLEDEESGSISIIGNPQLQTILYPPLIKGSLTIRDNDALPVLSFAIGGRSEISGDVEISGNDSLVQAACSADLIGGQLRIIDNPALAEIFFRDLTRAGAMLIARNGALQSMDFFSLATVGDSLLGLSLVGNPALQEIHFDSLSGATVLEVRDNDALTLLDFPALTHANSLRITDNDSLVTGAGFPALRFVLESATIERNAALTALALPALELGELLQVQENPALTTLDMPVLANLSTAVVRNNPVLPTCAVHALLDQASTQQRTVEGNDDAATCGAPIR